MSEEKRTKKEALEEIKAYDQETREQKKQWHRERLEREREDKRRFPGFWLREKIRKLRWKRSKATRREELKTRYEDAPWFTRVWNLYLVKPFMVLVILAVIAGVIALNAGTTIGKIISAYLETNRNKAVAQEEIYELSPIDEKGAKRIDAAAPVDKNDTWTISLYIVGSNLEDMNENDLSQVILSKVTEAKENQKKERKKEYVKRVDTFSDELAKNKLEIPSYLFYPQKPVPGTNEAASETTVAEEPGAASTDINEITAGEWSDNIKVVIQTGGATRWSNSSINPNRTQRFLYHKGKLSQLEDLPLENASDPKTLASFLNFCKKEYPADHNMLVLWNHGGGAFGYGVDSIYGGMMSLADIRGALESVYKPDINNPPFDIIGYDACLMSSVEVCHAMHGFASYYAVSEETEPGDGWDYTGFLQAMTDDPTMSPAKVCRAIADSYTDHYMTQNANVGWLISNDVTFEVVDAKKSEELYKAWCELSKQQLIDAASDGSVLAEMGRCSDKSTHLVSMAYNIYNTIDLGNYVDLMVDSYPDQCSKIKKLIGECVLYHRANGAVSDCQGMSIYMPGSVETYDGLLYCLDYIYNVIEDPSVKALYYYKIAGCLNDEMKEYLATISKTEPWILDIEPFREFMKTEPKITETGFEMSIGKDLAKLLENYELETAVLDKDYNALINYGKDETPRLDGEGNLDCEFDGKWICYDGVPLRTEVVSSTDSSVEYRSKVLYKNKESYLSFTYDRDTEKFTLNGIRSVSFGALISNDPFNYLVNSRMNSEIKEGDKIIPVYEVSLLGNKRTSFLDKALKKELERGKTIRVSKRSRIELKSLPAGYYLTSAVIGDQRGDVYYSEVVGQQVKGGKVVERKVESSFVGSNY